MTERVPAASAPPAPPATPAPDASRTPKTLRAESEAVYTALGAGAVGAVYGLVAALIWPALPLSGTHWDFGSAAALGAAAVAGLVSGIGYWRARLLPGQQWRQSLPSWQFTINTIAVVVAHVALAALAVLVAFLVFSLGFVGLRLDRFWAIALMAACLGLTAYIVALSVSRTDTQRMSSLLMIFVALGTLTSMVTTPDPGWWEYHFSQLGTYGTLSSVIFNGTLMAGGLLVTTFGVYLGNDMQTLVEQGRLRNPRSPRLVSALFAVMGVMLACVGIFHVDVHLILHNTSASGMAVMYLVLLIGGPKILRGMPRTYFLSAWAFLVALVVSLVLFIVQYFSLTAFEIIAFALIFGWIAVFIRFLGVTGQRG